MKKNYPYATSLMRTRLLYVSLLVVLLIGCTGSNNNNPNPAADWPGTYTCQMTSQDPANHTYHFDVSVMIRNGLKTGEVSLDINNPILGPLVESWTGTIQGTKITLPTLKPINQDDQPMEGSGTLTGKTLKLTLLEQGSFFTPVASVTHTITATRP
jgi:hypothetical protein